MTQPNLTPQQVAAEIGSKNSTPIDFDAADNLDRLATGNQQLVTNPGLLQSLQQNNATPQQAQAINSFMVGLDAQRQVRGAIQSGSKVVLGNDQTSALDAMGVDYSHVQYTAADAQADAQATQVKNLQADGMTPVYDATGKLVGAKETATKSAKSGGGWFSSPGDFLHHLTHNAVTNVLSEPWNVVDARVGAVGQSMLKPFQDLTHGDFSGALSATPTAAEQFATLGNASNVNAAVTDVGKGDFSGALKASIGTETDPQIAAQMKSMGYDPNNPFSVIAFQSHGYQHTDTSDLANAWNKENPNGQFGWNGAEAVTQAEDFQANPNAWIKQVANNNNLSAEEKSSLLGMSSDPQWTNFVTQVAGRQASIGNTFARTVGLDPVKDPTAFNLVSAGSDLVASFFLDPINVVGGMAKAAKVSSIGLDGLGDSNKIRTILDPANTSINAQKVQRGWQSLLTDSQQVREGLDAGTNAGAAQAAAAYAHARASTPAIADLMPDLIGDQQLDKAGNLVKGEPITNMADLTDYLASKNGLMRLTRGKAAIEGGLMPGAMSAFGFKALKGKAAASIAGRSASANAAVRATAAAKLDLRDPAVIDKLIVDPTNAVDANTGEKIVQSVQTNPATSIPAATGAINGVTPELVGKALDNATADKGVAGEINDLVPTVTTPTPDEAATLPSAVRGQLTAAQKGDLQLQARQGVAGQWARMKLSAVRVSTLLPRNTTVKLGDPESAEKIYRFGLQYLNKGDAALYGAMWARGGEGVQKSLVDGIIEQTGHAAGLGSTEAGRELQALLPDLNEQAYGHTGLEKFTDPGTGMVRDAAVFPSQVRQEFYLPNFQTLHRAGAKVGIWQNTVGRVFNSKVADLFNDTARMAMLAKPSIAVRNIVEGTGHLTMRGELPTLVGVKALLVDSAKSAADKAEDDLRNHGETNAKVIRSARRDAANQILTNRKSIIDRAVSASHMDRIGYLARKATGRALDDETAGYIHEFVSGTFADEYRPALNGYGDQIVGASPDQFGVDQTDKIFNQPGLRPQRMRRVGFGMEDTSGVLGADRYAQALGQRFGSYPTLDKAIVAAVKAGPGADLSDVITALKSPEVKPIADQMIRAHSYTDADGASRFARTDDERDIALQQIAERQVGDANYLMSNADGNHIDKVSDYLSTHTEPPSGKWVRENLMDGESMPKAVLAPQFAAVPQSAGPLGLLRGLLDSSGKMYKYIVEDQIKRTTTEPAFALHYGQQRKLLASVQKNLVDEGGVTDEVAQRVVHDVAVKRAYSQTEAMIDDPGLKTQADIVGKNFLMFSRAINAFGRRWGGLLVDDPTAFRKLFLVNEAAHHAGLSYVDANGNVNFTYPGSDLVMGAMTRLSQLVPGLGPAVTYPISGSIGGQVNMLAPGMNNPIRMSASPLVNTPAHLLDALAPAAAKSNIPGLQQAGQDLVSHQQLFDEIDVALNGQDAEGQSWFSELEPGALSKVTAALGTGRSSALNSSVVGAIANLAAADPDGSKGIFPGPNASPAEIEKFLSNVKQQVKNQLYLRAAFGEFAPAAPGLPFETNDASKADPLFKATGIQNLSNEYKVLLNDVGGDTAQATAIFTALHPERAVYAMATSKATASKAYLPDTATAENWINSSLPFIDDYKSVAAYFVPQDPGDFDLNAYRAQIETGLRQKDTPQEFLNQYMVNSAATTYYASLDSKNAAVANAQATGNTKLVSSIRANFSAWETQFDATHPSWAANEANQATQQQAALGQISELNRLVTDSDVPSSVKAYVPQINAMLTTYRTQQQWLQAHPAKSAAQITVAQAELADYVSHMTGITGDDPNLTSLYNGVFKPLNYTVSGG